MKTIRLSPIEVLIAKPAQKRTAIEQVIVAAYCNGDPNAEQAAAAELAALVAERDELRKQRDAYQAKLVERTEALKVIADSKNSHKRDGSVYIPDVVAQIARAALKAGDA